MSNGSIEDGWQRFLDRLKQLWGKLRDGELRGATVMREATVDTEATHR